MYKNSYPRDFVDKLITESLEKVLTPKIVVSTAPKKDLIIVLPYLIKLSLQMGTRINHVMKNKLPYYNFRTEFHTSCKLINLFTFKDKFSLSYILVLLITLSAVAAILFIIAKLSVILKSKCMSSLVFLLLLERERKGITILQLENIIYFVICNRSSGFDNFSKLASNNNEM